ncbi:uncharacterized protein LOC124173971 [Ischnura elegans]|uniref:uncharacterized protein LOC124173971 n=1 Tax=Ischnura elegans TaxID=197161 RepID=UPI001ED86B51|nr:uncharacterized protein LOC124173971 [Ischnura elegans]
MECVADVWRLPMEIPGRPCWPSGSNSQPPGQRNHSQQPILKKTPSDPTETFEGDPIGNGFIPSSTRLDTCAEPPLSSTGPPSSSLNMRRPGVDECCGGGGSDPSSDPSRRRKAPVISRPESLDLIWPIPGFADVPDSTVRREALELLSSDGRKSSRGSSSFDFPPLSEALRSLATHSLEEGGRYRWADGPSWPGLVGDWVARAASRRQSRASSSGRRSSSFFCSPRARSWEGGCGAGSDGGGCGGGALPRDCRCLCCARCLSTSLSHHGGGEDEEEEEEEEEEEVTSNNGEEEISRLPSTAGRLNLLEYARGVYRVSRRSWSASEAFGSDDTLTPRVEMISGGAGGYGEEATARMGTAAVDEGEKHLLGIVPSSSGSAKDRRRVGSGGSDEGCCLTTPTAVRSGEALLAVGRSGSSGSSPSPSSQRRRRAHRRSHRRQESERGSSAESGGDESETGGMMKNCVVGVRCLKDPFGEQGCSEQGSSAAEDFGCAKAEAASLGVLEGGVLHPQMRYAEGAEDDGCGESAEARRRSRRQAAIAWRSQRCSSSDSAVVLAASDDERLDKVPSNIPNPTRCSLGVEVPEGVELRRASEESGSSTVFWRTPSVVVSDYSDDLHPVHYLSDLDFMTEGGGGLSGAQQASGAASGEDAWGLGWQEARWKRASSEECSSTCSSIGGAGGSVCLEVLEGVVCVDGRKVSDCSTCSTLSGDDEAACDARLESVKTKSTKVSECLLSRSKTTQAARVILQYYV